MWHRVTVCSVQAIEKIEPKYKPSQAALTAFFKLHEPSDDSWQATFAVLEVTDGCPLNGMYRRSVPLGAASLLHFTATCCTRSAARAQSQRAKVLR